MRQKNEPKSEFGRYIDSRLAYAHVSQYALCERVGISPWTIRRRKDEPQSMTIEEWKILNETVGINPLAVCELAGYSTKDVLKALKGKLYGY